MSLDHIALLSQTIASVAVLASLLFVGLELRMNTTVNKASARHAISAFALELTKFRAEHADRIARLQGDGEHSEGDRQFLYWDQVNFILHAETYFRHHELGLMPKSHWQRYASWFSTSMMTAPAFRASWDDIGPAFSTEFAAWVDASLAAQRAPSGV
jgi:hypothetical protein